jgi:hypothetical protein
MKKLIIVFMLAMTASLTLADITSTNFWDNESKDGKWTTAINWTDNVVPSGTVFAGIGIDPNTCVLDATASCGGFELGIAPGIAGNLFISPTGNLTVSGAPTSVVAFVEGTGAVTANLTVEGTLTCDWQLSVGAWGYGTLNIQNGGIVKTGVLFFNNGNLSNAQVNIIDGTLQIEFQMAYGLSSFGGFTIDIKDGELLIADPAFTAAAAQAWTDLGFITGYGEEGNVAIEEVMVGGFPYRRLTAACKMYPADGDIVRDCVINLTDFAQMAEHWLNTGN